MFLKQYLIFRNRQIRIFQKSDVGVRLLDCKQLATEDGVAVERVVYLDKGDHLYFDFPPRLIQYVSDEPGAHTLGLFEI